MGNHSTDSFLELVELASTQTSLAERLSRMCATTAEVAHVDVCSVYVREPGPRHDQLVLRGNIGFPASAVDTTRLRLGEGLTGTVAQRLRPISAAVAGDDRRYKHIDGIGEESFPAYLGVPILDGPRACGVLVFQRRRAHAFSDVDVTIATALAAPFALAIATRPAQESGGRAARLRGLPLVGGAALGRVVAVPTLSALDNVIPGKPSASAVSDGLDQLERTLDRARRRLRRCDDREVERALENMAVVLADHRFRDRLQQQVSEFGWLGGLTNTARDYARVRYMVGGDADMKTMLAERAHEIESLCVLLHAHISQRRLLRKGCIVIASHLGAFVTLTAASRDAAAIASTGDVPAHAAAIARASNIPVVANVEGLFTWSKPGDLVIVDGDGGAVEINPATTTVAQFRKRTRATTK